LSRRTEIQVGITVLAALGITLWGVTWLKELQLSRKVHRWHVAFPQTGGLATSDEVQVNGLRKGNVEDLRLVGDHVVVDLVLSTDIVLTRASTVAVRNVGLMGEKVVGIDLVPGGPAWTDRDTIPGQYETGVPEVMAQVGSTLDRLDLLTRQMTQLTTTLTRNDDVAVTLDNLRATTTELRAAVSENRRTMRETLANLSAVSRTAKSLTTDREAQLRGTIDQLDRSVANVERLTARLDSLRATAQSISGKVDRGEGSLGRLVNDPQLYDDAKTSVAELKALIADIKKNPRKYIHLSIF
jgi:phospholipid/cholesterol/gamma-HCH transport system substrate-binding protein